MANYTLTGTLGSGKSIITVSRIAEYLLAKRSVCTNLDLFIENLLPAWNKQTYVRLMDFPTYQDLWDMGYGSNSKREDTFGGLFLDELAIFLNSRDWQGQGREKVIAFLRHVRKMHWHTFFLTQGIDSLDAQVRRDLIEHNVTCKRTDRLSIPLVGWILRLFGFSGKFGQMHLGVVHYGKTDSSPVVERWTYLGKGLHEAYNTDQVFSDTPYRDVFIPQYWLHKRPFSTPVLVEKDEKLNMTFYQEGTCSMLSAWHIKGRYLPKHLQYKESVKKLLYILSFVYLVFLLYQHGQDIRELPVINQTQTQPEKVKSFTFNGDSITYTTESGNIDTVYNFTTTGKIHKFQRGQKWFETY